ncbi:transcriptional regulator with XRE-family HTH domain [Nocardia transvalensis]|uniref:Transcriptional regulator with XRE-family HTH domain n=1 Tax=Nocardia transvalensis TaxID=37333 RepID=A0A7W9PKL9_9NOCA|nr:helix-turn-helix transcriptional regulator [Nocardia transvalensis]MBB5917932.1 transcriptional regulator with XRE-family HTH domain [Nocardia transvalensis]
MTSADNHEVQDEGPSSTLPRRQLGRFLREAREAAGFTLAQVAELVDISRPVIQRIEAGKIIKVRKQDVEALCKLYGVSPEDTEGAIDLAVQARKKSWHHVYGGLYGSAFNMYVGLEAAACQLTTCHNQHIPGLLQTADYARAIIGAFPEFTDEDIDRRVEHRLNRQARVTRKTNPIRLDVILHAAVLYRTIGEPTIMAAEMRHLAEMSKRPNIAIRIQPFSAGLTWGITHGSFIIMDFGKSRRGETVEPPVVFIEGGAAQDVYLEKPEDVRYYSELATAIRGTCLVEAESRNLLRQVAKEYERGRR